MNLEESKEISIVLTVKELQIVFKALGFQPFHEVYEIIGKIHEQTNQQMNADIDSENDHDSAT